MGPRRLAGLPAGALAWYLARGKRSSRLVVVPGVDEAEQLARDLGFYTEGEGIRVLPADDVRPYDGLSPSPSIPGRRVAALDALRRGAEVCVVAPAIALLQRVLPAPVLASARILDAGDRVDALELARKLAEIGYLASDRVRDPGEMARHGDVVDLWPPGDQAPARVELFGDEVESVRRLDPATGRTGAPAGPLRLLPAREEILDETTLPRASGWLRRRAAEIGCGEGLLGVMLSDMEAGIRFSGLDTWLPALLPLATPLELARGREVLVVHPERVRSEIEGRWRLIASRFDALQGEDRLAPGPEERFVPPPEVLAALEQADSVEEVAIEGATDLGCRENLGLALRGSSLAPVTERLRSWLERGWRVGLVVDGRLRAEGLVELLEPHGLAPAPAGCRDPERWPPGRLSLSIGALANGFHCPERCLAVITAGEILGARLGSPPAVPRPGERTTASETVAAGSAELFAKLHEGNLLVHRRHGIGRYLGLEHVEVEGVARDMLLLEYRGGDRLYLPVERMEQVSLYRAGGSGGERGLDRLGGRAWAARKARVRGDVLRLAHELLRLQATRKVRPGHAYEGVSARFLRFEQAFQYTETPDQARAIEEVLQDMARPVPMDRLVAGDVGFGKTEVAMRAAMRVVEDGRQVAVLCPTTVLAYQHHRVFTERFAPFGLPVELLSSFRDASSRKAAREAVASGEVQIVVGTTSLLGRAMRFADLGLVVIDEEHRFGVRQKERFKRLHPEVDVLALSATPIPRSLHMALGGLRDLSVISTPPPDRLPVRTSIARRTPERIREDLLHELRRGGQAFFVHNRISDLDRVAAELAEIVPEARMGVAHGQMEEHRLEEVLVRFIRRELNLLVCTAIVEAGVDLPNVNAILVDHPERFGLAQLYQLRGRVGRSHLRGTCTLLVDGSPSGPAARRLRVLQEHTALGSGLAIASADLDLRGAGSLLGDRQHGHMRAVGLDTYAELLDEAMAEASGTVARERLEPELELPVSAFFPESYLPGAGERLAWYKRLSSARDRREVRALGEALESERGELPLEALNLVRLLELKARCRRLGIARCHWLKVRMLIELDSSSPFDPERLRALERADRFGLRGESVLEVRFRPEEARHPLIFAGWALGRMERALGW